MAIETNEQFELREPVLSYKTDFGLKTPIFGMFINKLQACSLARPLIV